ncbi:uncharacterized protein [Triticum aestivum]|uniref:uncharacterized protein isoform X2 n=1 Tax=Triticum aestivum TaxID=4565 RepID=UPI001D002CAD|nr:uncharacterized protein LOC123161329 isoform X2 [Triticum aestivum]
MEAYLNQPLMICNVGDVVSGGVVDGSFGVGPCSRSNTLRSSLIGCVHARCNTCGARSYEPSVLGTLAMPTSLVHSIYTRAHLGTSHHITKPQYRSKVDLNLDCIELHNPYEPAGKSNSKVDLFRVRWLMLFL